MVRSTPLVLAILLAFASGSARAAPSAEPWARWTAHDETNRAAIDHGDWSRFLARYRRVGADGIARVAYGAVTAADRAGLAGYLDRLAGIAIGRYGRAEQLAYWLNLYDALVVKLVLDHYPVASIRDIDISPGWFARGPWAAKLVAVEGVPLSLDDIEHRILRPIWRDPLIHYGVNCAALGCPDLPTEAFTAENVGDLLERAAGRFINGSRGVRIVAGRLRLSSLYDWYETDFGGGEAEVIEHLRHYAAPPLAAALARIGRVDGYDYDWRLNDATP
jgi:Protein of unknown function, DUF547